MLIEDTVPHKVLEAFLAEVDAPYVAEVDVSLGGTRESMKVVIKGIGEAAARVLALEYMAKGLEQSAAARAERAGHDSATLKTHRGCPLGSQRVALGSNHNKRGVTDREEEIRKAKKSIDETTAFIEKVEVEMAERPDAYWTVVSAFSKSSKMNTPKLILNTMVRLFISDEKISVLGL